MFPEVKIEQDMALQRNDLKIERKNSSESQQFELQYHQIKKLGYSVNKKKLSIGNWSSQENYVYLKFLIDNKLDFASEKQRRKNKVFYRLSKILKKRTPDQCRSHHQKLQMKYQDSIQHIIDSIHRKLLKKSPGIFEKKLKESRQEKIKIDNAVQLEEKQYQSIQSIQIGKGGFYQVELRNKSEVCLLLNFNKIQAWRPYKKNPEYIAQQSDQVVKKQEQRDYAAKKSI